MLFIPNADESRSFAVEVLIQIECLDNIGVGVGIQFHNMGGFRPELVVDASPSDLDLSTCPPRNGRIDMPTLSYSWLLKVTVY